MAAMVATVCNTIDIMINTLSTIRQTFKRLNCSALSYKNTQIFRILPVALRKKRQPEATESGIPGPESEGGNYGDGGRERGRQTGEQQMDGRAADGTCMAYVITVADRRAAAGRRTRQTDERGRYIVMPGRQHPGNSRSGCCSVSVAIAVPHGSYTEGRPRWIVSKNRCPLSQGGILQLENRPTKVFLNY